MSFEIKLFYMDGEDLDVNIFDERNMSKFLESMEENEVYFDEEKESGIWIPIDKVRYFLVNRTKTVITNGESNDRER